MRSDFLDQLSVSEQLAEVIRILNQKLHHAKENRTMAEKKLREIYGEKSRQDVILLQLRGQLATCALQSPPRRTIGKK